MYITEPKDALDFAIAYEEGTLRQTLYGETKVLIKNKPTSVKTEKKDCLRCGTKNFLMEHLKICPGKSKKCNKCGVLGRFVRVCRKQQQPQNSQKQPPRLVNLVDEESDNNAEQEAEEQYVLGIIGGGSPLFMMKSIINRKKFCLMIDSGSPVTVINQEQLQKILQYKVLFISPQPKDEKYVDNKKPVNLLVFIFCKLKVGGKYKRKTRILVA